MDLTSISKKLTDATTALAKADNDLKLEIAGAAADMAGIVDPTPASDIVGAGISIARGDYWGAALSTASMVPYLGDAVAKPVKAVRATKAIAGLKTKVAALTKVVNDLKKAKKEAEVLEAAKQAKIAKEADVAKDGAAKQEKAAAKKEKDCEDCGSTGANSTTQLPISGETPATATGKSVHTALAAERRASGDFDLVNEPIRDADGIAIQVTKRADLKTGEPLPQSGNQIARPDAVRRDVIIDDKPLDRPISKDRQEIIRFINAYKESNGTLPRTIGIQRYDPRTGLPVRTDLYVPSDFMPWSKK